MKIKSTIFGSLLAVLSVLLLASAHSHAVVISSVDTSLIGSQKYVLRVDGKPYLMTNIQVRLDKLRYRWGWDAAARSGIVAQAASDGFNTVSIPIHWYEVEPTKNNFDWMILDEYLGLCKNNNLKMELLWFGTNSGGDVQWLGDNTNPIHLRTPDYVLYSSAPESTNTTSDYTILLNLPYCLDQTDAELRDREAYVLGLVMEHIVAWDAANGNPHTVIGVQIENECTGQGASVAVAYASSVARGVKNSSYVVWTRMNCINGDTAGRINANEALRNGAGTNIDFVGIDIYGYTASGVKTVMPTIGKNYKMIMEAGAEVSSSYLFPLSALSGGTAFDYYDMIGPDGHGLYDRVDTMGWTPNGVYIADVRTVNRLINGAQSDLALNTHQVASNGLFVHNSSGSSTASSTGVAGISFTPSDATSQGVSIVRNSTEFVLINTKGGSFTYPITLGITGASQGYFDSNDVWVNQGNLSFTSTSITPPTGTIIRLTTGSTTLYKAENLTMTLSSGVIAEVSNDGGSGGEWVDILSDSIGDYVEFDVNVPSAGYYFVVTVYRSDTNRGIAQLAINGADFGSPIDMYQSSATFTEASIPVNFDVGGNQTFRYRIIGKNASSTGYQMGIDCIQLTRTPAAPTGLVAIAGDGPVFLSWNDNVEPDLSYIVYRSPTSGGGYTAIATDVLTSDYVDNTVSNGTTYYYVVTATDTSSNESANSNEVSITAGPRGVVAVTATLPGVTNSSASGPTLATSANFDKAGGNAVALLVTLERSGSGDAISATFAGQPMTLGVSINAGIQWSGVFYLIDPAVTNGQFVITTTGSSAAIGYSAIALSGVGSVADVDAVANTSSGSTISLVTMTKNNYGFVLGAVVNNGWDGSNPPPSYVSGDADQILLDRVLIGSSGHLHTYGDVPVAGSNSNVYGNTVQRNAYITLAFEPGAAAHTGTPTFNTDPINEINATEDAAYHSTLADDTSDPETDSMIFSKVSGPAWLTVAANGDLSGTPGDGDVGVNSWMVQIDDSDGASDTATLNINVANVYSGALGMPDLQAFAAQWLMTGCIDIPACDGADLDGDKDVDMSDLAELCRNWIDEI